MKAREIIPTIALMLLASAALAQNNGGSLPSNKGDYIANGGASGNMTAADNAGGASNATTGAETTGAAAYGATTQTSADLPPCSATVTDRCIEGPRHSRRHRG